MTSTTFLVLLSSFSTITALATEGIKKFTREKAGLSYNIIVLIVALLVGTLGTAAYYQLDGLPFTADSILHMLLMGLASGLVSMTSYDKVKQAVEQLAGRKNW